MLLSKGGPTHTVFLSLDQSWSCLGAGFSYFNDTKENSEIEALSL